VWTLFLVLQVPGLRALARSAPGPWRPVAALYLIGAFFLYAWCRHWAGIPGGAPRLLRIRALPMVAVTLLAIVNAVSYPVADGLKRVGRGSDQDDALILTGERLLAGQRPYAAVTYLDHRPSPGPGWVLLALPFTVTGLYFLLTPVFVWIAAAAVRAAHGVGPANVFLLLLASSPGFWETMIVGSDMFAIGALFVVTAVLAHSCRSPRTAPWVAALAGLASTSRLPFASIVPLLAAFLWKREHSEGVRFFLIAGGAAAFLHAGFLAWDPAHYWPAHLFAKAQTFLPPALAAVATAASVVVVVTAVVKDTGSLDSWLTHLAFCLGVPLAFLAFGDLAWSDFELARWQGANYLMVPLPLYLAGRAPLFARSLDPAPGNASTSVRAAPA
jgi:hypothetical protein